MQGASRERRSSRSSSSSLGLSSIHRQLYESHTRACLELRFSGVLLIDYRGLRRECGCESGMRFDLSPLLLKGEARLLGLFV